MSDECWKKSGKCATFIRTIQQFALWFNLMYSLLTRGLIRVELHMVKWIGVAAWLAISMSGAALSVIGVADYSPWKAATGYFLFAVGCLGVLAVVLWGER